MEIPQVNFKVPSYEELAEKVYRRVKSMKENYRNNVYYLEIHKELFNKIQNTKFMYVKKELVEMIKKSHNLEELEKYKEDLEAYWKPLNKLFFENLKKITGFDSPYKEYIVYITKIIRGSYTPTNEVFTNPKEKIRTSGFITAEELLHIYYWSIFRKIIKDEELPWMNNYSVWEISETIPEYILTDKSFREFGWPENLNRKYPFIAKWKEKLDIIWKSKKNFKDFLIKAHRGIV